MGPAGGAEAPGPRARPRAAVVALPGLRPAGAARGARALLRLARGRDPGRQRLERDDRGAAARDRRRRHARRDPRADLHALRADDDDPRRRAGARAGCCRQGPWTGRNRPPPEGRRGPLVYDVDALIEARRASGATLTIVCSPNNPTGSSLPLGGRRAAVRRRRRARRDRRGVPRVRRRERRCRCSSATPTWSCCAPSRRRWRSRACASATCSPRPSSCARSNKARLPYNVNFFSQAAALAALEEKDAAGRERAAPGRRARAAAGAARRPAGRARLAVARELLPARAARGRPEGRLRRAAAARRAGARRDLLPDALALPARERRLGGGERGLPARARHGARRGRCRTSGWGGRDGGESGR